MIEIDIPHNIPAGAVPVRLIETIAEQVLKSVLPDEDFSVTINFEGHRKLIIDWQAVN